MQLEQFSNIKNVKLSIAPVILQMEEKNKLKHDVRFVVDTITSIFFLIIKNCSVLNANDRFSCLFDRLFIQNFDCKNTGRSN